MRRGILVVGGGLAGLITALRTAEGGVPVTVLLPELPEAGSSHYAQGGLAAVLPGSDDSMEDHFRDTMKAGAGLSDSEVVRFMVERAPHAVRLLEEYGVRFDRQEGGEYDRHREGGHNAFRVVHVADETGKHLMRHIRKRALNHSGIQIMAGAQVTQLLKSESGRVSGVVCHYQGEELRLEAGAVVLATGGIGQLYRVSTNPAEVWGSGQAMAAEMGASLADMAFVQFHPTALYTDRPGRSPLISEAVRGAGAVLVDHNGYRFMPDLHPDADLATRDVVARAIYQRMRDQKAPHMYLDASGIADFEGHFPGIYGMISEAGVKDLSRIPVAPAAHYSCGGIRATTSGYTDVPGLFAVGEVARTGLHGANRLASNSLLEAVITADAVATAITQWSAGLNLDAVRVVSRKPQPTVEKSSVLDLRESVSAHLGVTRNREELTQAVSQWKTLFASESNTERRRRLLLAIAIGEDSLRREGSVGALWWE